MTVTPILLPGNMVDARLWRGGGNAIHKTLRAHFGIDAVDVALSDIDSIAAMAEAALAATPGRLLPVGFSMGAIVAAEMATIASERITGLVLLGYNASADLPERAVHRPRQQDDVCAGHLDRVLIEELKPKYLAASRRGDAALLELLLDMGRVLGPDVFVRQSEALRTRADRRAALGGWRMPVLLGCGMEDVLCPPAWHRDWADRIADARVVVFDDAGHLLPLEAPGALAAEIDRWLTDKDLA